MSTTQAAAGIVHMPPSGQPTRLETWDIMTIALYFVLVVGVGLLAMCRSNRGTVSGYFLAGRSMMWLPVGASLFVSNIGSEHLIGLAGSGAAIGFAVAAWELNALIILQMLGFLFVPVYITSGVVTMPEYLSKRFGGRRLRVFVAILSLLLYIFTKVSVNLYAGGLFIQQSLGWNLYLSMIGLILITAVLTVTGGLAAVIYTDTLQAVLMVIGTATLAVFGFLRVGGYESMKEQYMRATPNTTLSGQTPGCGVPLNDSFILLREPTDPDVPWPGFVLGQSWATIWYWCTDQVIVQRALAAKSLSHAKGATLLAAFIKILPLFLMVMPGMISRILYTDEVMCVDPEICQAVCQSTSCTNIAFPRLVLGVMPVGFRGLMMSVMIAALMSDLDSIFNSSSTLFTIDIWKRAIRPKASVREMMIVGRLWVIVMVCLSIAWVPVMLLLQDGQLFLTIQEISGYLSPPIAAVFIFGMFWTRGNEQGAFWGMMAGIVVGTIRMVLVFAFQGQAGSCLVEDTRPAWYHTFVGNVHFMYYAIVIFGVTLAVAIAVSLLTAPPSSSQICRATWWTRNWSQLRTDNLEEEINATSKLVDIEKKMEADGEISADNRSVWRKGYDWFCGYNSVDPEITETEKMEKLHKITSIKQNPKAALFLNFMLVLVLSVAVFLFVFFTIP